MRSCNQQFVQEVIVNSSQESVYQISAILTQLTEVMD